MRKLWLAATAAVLLLGLSSPAGAWDSAQFKLLTRIVHPTHSYLTEYAVDQLRGDYPELQEYRDVLIEGANQELHELPVKGTLYGVDLEKKRVQHNGTNAGSDDVPGWWKEAKSAYAAGNTEQAYFYVGIMLHMIQDMGVPAHANGVYHQGNISEFDNFEAMAALKWAPDFSTVNRKDPRYADPSKYYALSKQWAHADAPDYNDPDSFSKTWFTGSDEERELLSKRQARTATVVMWSLRAAARAFAN